MVHVTRAINDEGPRSRGSPFPKVLESIQVGRGDTENLLPFPLYLGDIKEILIYLLDLNP